MVEVLKKATGTPNEALVFRIVVRGNLEVVLESETPWCRTIKLREELLKG